MKRSRERSRQLAQLVAVAQQVTGAPIDPAGNSTAPGAVPLSLPIVQEQLDTVNTRIASAIQQVLALLQQFMQTVPDSIVAGITANNNAVVIPGLQALAGASDPATARSLTYLYELLQQDMADDATTANDLMSKYTALQQAHSELQTLLSTVQGTANAAKTDVVLARTVADQALSQTAQQQTTLTDLGQKVATNTTEVAKRMLKTEGLLKAGDTATGPIMVPKATQDAAAPRLEQTYGGLNAPIRYATSVGNTPVAMLPGPLTDPTPQGRKAKPYFVILTMRGAATVAATITVGTTPGGAEVFSRTYLLTGLPVLNNVLAPLQPVFIELPAGTTLYAKATSGSWDVEVLSYYKS